MSVVGATAAPFQQKEKMPVQQNPSFSGDPVETAISLVREHGLDRARQIAVEGTTSANEQGNLYRLSVWREVKRILNDWTEPSELA